MSEEFPTVEEQMAAQRAEQEQALRELEELARREVDRIAREQEEEHERSLLIVERNNAPIRPPEIEESDNFGPPPPLNNQEENLHNDGGLDEPIPAEQVTEPESYAPVTPPAVRELPPLSQFGE
jgi:hypothetical protein